VGIRRLGGTGAVNDGAAVFKRINDVGHHGLA
jgi:hypothetical protein